jgi:hypothetical protein
MAQDLSVVLGIVGAVATVPITVSLPGLYQSRLFADSAIRKAEGRAGLVIGTVLMGFCLYGTLAGAAT